MVEDEFSVEDGTSVEDEFSVEDGTTANIFSSVDWKNVRSMVKFLETFMYLL